MAVVERPRKRRRSSRQRSLEVERGSQWADELAGLLNWSEIQDRAERDNGNARAAGDDPPVRGRGSGADCNDLPSCWQVLGFKNFNQLLTRRLPQLQAHHRHAITSLSWSSGAIRRSRSLEAQPGRVRSGSAARRLAARRCRDDPASPGTTSALIVISCCCCGLTRGRWTVKRYLDRLEEPAEGNPLTCPGRRAARIPGPRQLGARILLDGRGGRVRDAAGESWRSAAATAATRTSSLELNPHIQYTLVDIPPALWVAQRYLSSVFPGTAGSSACAISAATRRFARKWSDASIVFLLPHQLELMPDRPLRPEHEHLVLRRDARGADRRTTSRTLERVTRGHFYMKQWKVSQNAFDKLSLTEKDYPSPPGWRKVYSRSCAVQTDVLRSSRTGRGRRDGRGNYCAVYDFELMPYALGDVLTWNVQTAIRCEEAGPRRGRRLHLPRPALSGQHLPARPGRRGELRAVLQRAVRRLRHPSGARQHLIYRGREDELRDSLPRRRRDAGECRGARRLRARAREPRRRGRR